MTGRTRLFVYGSLMRGEANAHHLGAARYLGPACTKPIYTLLDLGPFPALLEGGASAVRGEIYELDAAALRAIDVFEEHPHVYRRALVHLAGGVRAQAYFLVRRPAAARVIADGDWRRVRPRRPGRARRSGVD
jgi:gamma-glutamylcyclotransferase (GGCT)/AIG2-like uncharacterized protein YtfP